MSPCDIAGAGNDVTSLHRISSLSRHRYVGMEPKSDDEFRIWMNPDYRGREAQM
jgi:hypothetical protein